ncbi:SDR family oxidoreductase [Streptomyces sp. NPDC056309]|uniref:SDR family NAD(P)-dependent oxidoreductase n=1 Tax=unclassified Streptomyces TaxID=2593676 RepID=UPI0035DBE531
MPPTDSKRSRLSYLDEDSKWSFFAVLTVDEPLHHLLADPRAACTTVVDNLWVPGRRRPVLAARRNAIPLPKAETEGQGRTPPSQAVVATSLGQLDEDGGCMAGSNKLDGKRALVIGGGGAGIGRAIVRACAAAGAGVVVADVDAARATEAADELRAAGHTAHALSADVRSREQLEHMIADAAERLGGLDTLITVVGGQVAHVPAVKLHEMDDEDWDTVYDVNLRYVARAVRRVLRLFLEQGTGGNIVSIGSVTGFMAAPKQAGYGAAKAGLYSLARTVAAEYAADGIRMNVVAGGAISTAVGNTNPTGEWLPEIPAGRYGTSEEMAAATVYLASDEARYITGQQIVLDGGVSVRGPFPE